MSTNGASTNVGSVAEDLGDFTTLLLDINPSLTLVGYPTAWKQYAIKISGLTAPVNGRIAFRYYVADGGQGSNSYKIGIDDIVFSTESTTLDAGPGFTSYQWSNGATTQVTTAGPSEILSVTVKNGNGCEGTSAVVTTTIKPALTPALSIALSTQPAFLGSPVTFNATPLNGGTAPTYQWKVNGVNAGINSSTFTSSTLTSGQLVTCVMTTSETCKTVDTALSNSITMNLLNTYTFTGTGNWNLSANWDNNTVPPASLPRGCTIIINPSSGECLLNTPQTISSGASISVSAGKKFRMLGNLRIQ
jgi:hypothetical protein